MNAAHAYPDDITHWGNTPSEVFERIGFRVGQHALRLASNDTTTIVCAARAIGELLDSVGLSWADLADKLDSDPSVHRLEMTRSPRQLVCPKCKSLRPDPRGLH